MFKRNYPEFWNHRGLYSFLLYPFSLIYQLLGFLRQVFCKEKKLGSPVICIGNATVGGTGKTSLIKAFASYLATTKKKKIVVISKGYGGSFVKPTIVEPGFSPCLVGDEAVEIAEKLFKIGDITIIVAKTPKDCLALLNQIKADIILVDDGLQNPSFYKDFRLLMIDGMRGFGNNMLIPAGCLREPSSKALAEADMVVSVEPNEQVKTMLHAAANDKIFVISKHIECPINKDDKLFLVCAIGNPAKFFNYFEHNYQIAGKLTFPDHHKYNNNDIIEIATQAKKLGANAIITTAKDYVKLRDFKFDIKLVVANENYNDADLQKIYEKISEKIPL